jgi:hypothetical protein
MRARRIAAKSRCSQALFAPVVAAAAQSLLISGAE